MLTTLTQQPGTSRTGCCAHRTASEWGKAVEAGPWNNRRSQMSNPLRSLIGNIGTSSGGRLATTLTASPTTRVGQAENSLGAAASCILFASASNLLWWDPAWP